MLRETEITKVEFDVFWFDSVKDGVAYFFRWLGEPRSTILVVWNNDGPTHIEYRKVGDLIGSEAESMPMIAEITHMFRSAGLGRNKTDHWVRARNNQEQRRRIFSYRRTAREIGDAF
jgi:hypothetical protein